MNEFEMIKIRELSSSIVKGISDGLIKFPGSEDFPIGCCGNASEVLLRKLKSEGFKEVKYNWGWKNNKSHGWLEYKNYIIDITLNQFSKNSPEGVLICPVNESVFHSEFKK